MKATDLIPELVADVPGCPNVAAERAIFNAAREFVRESGAWYGDIDPFTTSADVAEYELDLPPGGVLLAIRKVWCGERQLSPAKRQDMNLNIANNAPYAYTFSTEPATLMLYPTPRGEEEVRVVAVFQLLDTARNLLPDLLREYNESLLHGARARLFATAGHPWSNPAMAGYHNAEFTKAKFNARVRAETEGLPAQQRVRNRRIG